jgi:hypothetical protein
MGIRTSVAVEVEHPIYSWRKWFELPFDCQPWAPRCASHPDERPDLRGRRTGPLGGAPAQRASGWPAPKATLIATTARNGGRERHAADAIGSVPTRGNPGRTSAYGFARTGNAVWGNPSRVRIPPSPPPFRLRDRVAGPSRSVAGSQPRLATLETLLPGYAHGSSCGAAGIPAGAATASSGSTRAQWRGSRARRGRRESRDGPRPAPGGTSPGPSSSTPRTVRVSRRNRWGEWCTGTRSGMEHGGPAAPEAAPAAPEAAPEAAPAAPGAAARGPRRGPRPTWRARVRPGPLL